MTTARDELVDVIVDGLVMTRMSDFAGTDLVLVNEAARHVVAALVERYGEPEIEQPTEGPWPDPHRRLVFQWKQVTE